MSYRKLMNVKEKEGTYTEVIDISSLDINRLSSDIDDSNTNLNYNDFKITKSNNTIKKNLNILNFKDAGIILLKIIGFLAKQGYKLCKIAISITAKGIVLTIKAMNDLLGLVSGLIQIGFHKLDTKGQDRAVKSMLGLFVGTVVMFGAVVMNQRTKIEHLDSNPTPVASVASVDSVKETENHKPTVTNEDTTKNAKTLSTSSLGEFIGDVAFKGVNGGTTTKTIEVRYKDSSNKIVKTTSKAYGIGGFTTVSNKKSVSDFIKYMKSIDEDFYLEYFDGVDAPGTITFDTAWDSAYKTEKDKFTQMQCDYIYNQYVKTTVESVKEEFGIDLMSNKALKEFVFSTAYQYGAKGTLKLLTEANITKDMSSKDIIEKVQAEKINSLGKYTYTNASEYTDSDRASIKTQIESETKDLLNLI